MVKKIETKSVTKAPTTAPVNKFAYVEPPSYGISGREGALEPNEVYDEADIASALEAGFIAQALQRHKEKVAPEKHPDFDGEHCLDCDVEIPLVRLEMGKIRCVDCQSELEKSKKFLGKY
jgi:RNA polymerase-binding transcription factor DksA